MCFYLSKKRLLHNDMAAAYDPYGTKTERTVDFDTEVCDVDPAVVECFESRHDFQVPDDVVHGFFSIAEAHMDTTDACRVAAFKVCQDTAAKTNTEGL